jgi:hypothetical protein
METPLVYRKTPKVHNIVGHALLERCARIQYYSVRHGTVGDNEKRLDRCFLHLVTVISSSAVPGQRVDDLGY